MIKKLTKLVDVKSIITLLFGGVFAYLAIIGKISEDSFMTVFVMIMTYYFAKNKSSKSETETDKTNITTEEEINTEN